MLESKFYEIEEVRELIEHIWHTFVVEYSFWQTNFEKKGNWQQ